MLTAKEKQVIGEARKALEATHVICVSLCDAQMGTEQWTDARHDFMDRMKINLVSLASLSALENEGGEAPVEAGKVCGECGGSGEVPENEGMGGLSEAIIDGGNPPLKTCLTCHGTGQATPEAKEGRPCRADFPNDPEHYTEALEHHLDHLTGRDNKESEGCRNCEGTGEVAGWPSHKTPLAIPSVRCPYCLGTGQATPEAKGGENK